MLGYGQVFAHLVEKNFCTLNSSNQFWEMSNLFSAGHLTANTVLHQLSATLLFLCTTQKKKTLSYDTPLILRCIPFSEMSKCGKCVSLNQRNKAFCSSNGECVCMTSLSCLLAGWFAPSFSSPKLCLSLPYPISPRQHKQVDIDLDYASKVRD